MFNLEFKPLGGLSGIKKFIIDGNQATGYNQHGFEYSVVGTELSYGGERGLYEFAGLDKDGEVVDESVTGWLTLEDATNMAKNWKGK